MATFDLVFEGGGAKGIVFVGALKALREAGHDHRRLVGTSAGAITATFVAAGFTTDRMGEIMTEQADDGRPRFATFMDTPSEFAEETVEASFLFDMFQGLDLPLVPNWLEDRIDRSIFNQLNSNSRFRRLFSFIERGGLYKGDAFMAWLREKLAEDNGDEAASPEQRVRPQLATATLEGFHDLTGVDLSMVVSDTTAKQMRILNHRTAPNVPIVDAVRMTMSIPFVWQEVIWQSEWGPYRGAGAAEDLTGNVIVDGGMLSNFPLDLVNDPSPTIMGDVVADDAGTIGLLIDETLPVPGSGEPAEERGDRFESRVISRIKRLANTMTDAHDRRVIDANPNQVCRLPAQGYGTTEFDMSPERRDALVDAGENAMQEFLAALS